jgi:hypothetical protein
MRCRKRDTLLKAYFRAQAAQAKAVAAVIRERAPEKHGQAIQNFRTLGQEVLERQAALEMHYVQHGCQLY